MIGSSAHRACCILALSGSCDHVGTAKRICILHCVFVCVLVCVSVSVCVILCMCVCVCVCVCVCMGVCVNMRVINHSIGKRNFCGIVYCTGIICDQCWIVVVNIA